jgi:hypothetical protein
MNRATQIREIILSYFSHGDPDKFLVKYSQLTYGIEATGDAEAIELKDQIRGALAKVRTGIISQSEFVESLRSIATSGVVEIAFVSTGTSARPVSSYGAIVPSWLEKETPSHQPLLHLGTRFALAQK